MTGEQKLLVAQIVFDDNYLQWCMENLPDDEDYELVD